MWINFSLTSWLAENKNKKRLKEAKSLKIFLVLLQIQEVSTKLIINS